MRVLVVCVPSTGWRSRSIAYSGRTTDQCSQSTACRHHAPSTGNFTQLATLSSAVTAASAALLCAASCRQSVQYFLCSLFVVRSLVLSLCGFVLRFVCHNGRRRSRDNAPTTKSRRPVASAEDVEWGRGGERVSPLQPTRGPGGAP